VFDDFGAQHEIRLSLTHTFGVEVDVLDRQIEQLLTGSGDEAGIEPTHFPAEHSAGVIHGKAEAAADFEKSPDRPPVDQG